MSSFIFDSASVSFWFFCMAANTHCVMKTPRRRTRLISLQGTALEMRFGPFPWRRRHNFPVSGFWLTTRDLKLNDDDDDEIVWRDEIQQLASVSRTFQADENYVTILPSSDMCKQWRRQDLATGVHETKIQSCRRVTHKTCNKQWQSYRHAYFFSIGNHIQSNVGICVALKWWQQESLANAKVSARQPWYIGRNSLRIAQQYQRNIYIVEKYFQCAIIPSLTMRVYLHSFSRCCLPNTPASAKFRENLNL